MKRLVLDSLKVIIIFIFCTSLFYFGLKMMHQEHIQFHKYDEPKGPAVKVFQGEEQNLIDRLSIFFRLGE